MFASTKCVQNKLFKPPCVKRFQFSSSDGRTAEKKSFSPIELFFVFLPPLDEHSVY